MHIKPSNDTKHNLLAVLHKILQFWNFLEYNSIQYAIHIHTWIIPNVELVYILNFHSYWDFILGVSYVIVFDICYMHMH